MLPISGALVKAGLWCLLVISVLSVFYFGIRHVYNVVYDNGVTAERKIWQDKQIEDLAKHNAKVLDLEKQLAQQEKDHAARIAEIDKQHQEKIENVNKQKAADIAAANSGGLKLRWIRETEVGRGANGATGKAIGEGSSFCNDSKGGELPAKITADLYELVNDADANTIQLTEAQEVIKTYQLNCN